MPFQSKLPDVGTTIFTVMSRRARELGALNLGQGFPDYDIDPRLTELTAQAMTDGHNQYAPMEGVMGLRVQIASKLEECYGVGVDPETQITVTVGGTEALYCAIQAIVGQGDEAIVFDPAYDSYDPAVRLAGGRCIHIPLLPPGFRYDWDRVRATITDRTRLIIINTPHNPACTVATADDLDRLAGSHPQAKHLRAVGRSVRARSVRRPQACRACSRIRSCASAASRCSRSAETLHSTGLRVGYGVAPTG